MRTGGWRQWWWRGFSDRQRRVGSRFLLSFIPRGGDAHRQTNVAVNSGRCRERETDSERAVGQILMRPLFPSWGRTTTHCPGVIRLYRVPAQPAHDRTGR